jgi:hypothetical protein
MNSFLLIALLWVGLNLAFPFVLMAVRWGRRRKLRLASRFAPSQQEERGHPDVSIAALRTRRGS